MPRLWLALATCLFLVPAYAQLSPQVVVREMGRGTNLGNTLEPPTEGAWNNGPAQEYYFDDFVAAGFQTVRIPVRWDEHTSTAAPYDVAASWMNRVEEVVDWGLERDLYIILNAHHEDWIKQNYSDPEQRDRFDAIWRQIAERFRDKPDKLLFEIINEPFGMTREEVDDLNARTLATIRETNPTRIVIFSGNEWSGAQQLLAAAVPDDPYLMGYFHAYFPWQFAGLAEGTWGTDADRQDLDQLFREVADWSRTTRIPVMISEFGALRWSDFNSRMALYAAYVEESLEHTIPFQVWDDGGQFGLYEREARTWAEEKDILIHTYQQSPTRMAASLAGDTLVTLTWQNRTDRNQAIHVERRTLEGSYERIAELPASASSFADTSAAGGVTYRYRVIAAFSDFDDWYGYPIEVFAPPTQRSNFLGAPFAIPGTIEAEDFDEGGEGLTYHDMDVANIPGAYRSNVSVDIEARDDGGYQVAYIESGEWLEYTINVPEAGTYEITTYVASLEGGGRFSFEAGEVRSTAVRVPRTDSWQALTTASATIDLPVGEQVLRLNVLVARPFNVDRFTIASASATAVEPVAALPGFAVYPNPARHSVAVEVPAAAYGARLDVYNLLGQRVRSERAAGPELHLDLGALPAGLYLLRLMRRDQVLVREYVIKR